VAVNITFSFLIQELNSHTIRLFDLKLHVKQHALHSPCTFIPLWHYTLITWS